MRGRHTPLTALMSFWRLKMSDGKAKRTRRKIFYRVSVLDEKLNKYIVRHCSLTRGEAVRLVEEYAMYGAFARFFQCVKD